MKGNIKNLDLRGMLLSERHEKIFDMLGNLSLGETLRITNDHDPKPLRYMLEAEYNGQFEWAYEKQGPADWIVKIKRIKATGAEESRKDEVKALLKELHSGADAGRIKERGRRIFKEISPTDLGLIEQEIIKEGVSREEMRKLCDVHLDIMKEGIEKAHISLQPGHPIHTFMEEHKMILDSVEKLQETLNALKSKKNFDDAHGEIEVLKHIAGHLVEADKHHEREEKVLFPELESHGVSEPPAIMLEEHNDIKPVKKALHEIANSKKEMQYSNFISKVQELAEYLISNLPNHIYKEDNILYPMALQAIPNEKWAEIKKRCDRIGYCCFTPKLLVC
ncbi:MAG: DUF438 domain-containing protein [Candidatus Diapherotrites archaeon]|nr:DUF438 domain-containing protein [Candidatus Diapherotrites archaeon]